jgi:cytidylate kinase
MPIVIITDGVFGCGEVLAKRVSARLGYRYIGEEGLLKAIQLNTLIEPMPANLLDVEPSWWKRLRENRRLYRVALQAAICEMGQGSKFVYHGRAGHALVPSVRQVLKILLMGSNEFRIEQIRHARGLGRESARRWLVKADNVSDRRMKAIFGVGWRDPNQHDLVLNVSKLSFETAACMVVQTAGEVAYHNTEELDRKLENFALESKIRVALMTSKNTRLLHVDIQANAGLVHVSGFLHPVDFDFKNDIIRIAEGVAGVRDVTADLQRLCSDDALP